MSISRMARHVGTSKETQLILGRSHFFTGIKEAAEIPFRSCTRTHRAKLDIANT
jgi:hypothetical protein